MTIDPPYVPETLSRADVDATPGPLVLGFGTNWCGFCQASEPKITEGLARAGDAPHVRVEDGKGRALGRGFDVKLWPTLVFLRDGKEMARVVRPKDAQEVATALAAITAPG